MTAPALTPPMAPAHPGAEVRITVLDGFRGLAILLVLVVHFTPDYLMPNRPLEWAKKFAHTGWVGVDLFFVLSGFLITGILLDAKGGGNYFRAFYGRRALRILPLYLAVLAFTFWLVPLVWPSTSADPGFVRMQEVQGWLWAHCANVAVLLHGFDSLSSATINLPHLWSLAVEEHFYLVWPLVVWFTSERRLPWVCGAVILAAIAFRLLALGSGADFSTRDPFNMTHLRMDGLALGGLLALLLRRVPPVRLRNPALVLMGVCSALVAVVFFRDKGLWVAGGFVRSIGFTVIALFFAAAMVWMLGLPEGSRWKSLLDNAPMRFFGKYSYGLYLLHGVAIPTFDRYLSEEIALAWLHNEVLASVACVVVKTALSVGLALVSWKLLEEPCLRLKRWFRYRSSAQVPV